MTVFENRSRYFGNMYTAPVYFGAEHVPVPVGQRCPFCNEGFQQGDDGFLDMFDKAIHRECMIREAVGSVSHQMRLCQCFLGDRALTDLEDDEGLTSREAAKRAMNFFFETM